MNKKPLFRSMVVTLTFLTTQAFASDYPRHSADNISWFEPTRPAISFDSKSCLPIAAVDQWGNANAGLSLGGHSNGDCRSPSLTQAYTRHMCKLKSGTTDIYCGILYSYYFEKDQYRYFNRGGHRHDWEHVIMWVKLPDSNPTNITAEFMTISDHTSYREFDLRESYPGDSWNGNIRNIGGLRYYVRYWRTTGGAFTNGMDIRTTNDSVYGDEYVKYTYWGNLSTQQQQTIATDGYGDANQRLSDAEFNQWIKDLTPNDFPVTF